MAQIHLLCATAPRPRLADCAARHLLQSQGLRSLETVRIHVRLLEPCIGKAGDRDAATLWQGLYD
jgi:hypothetical protein